MSVRIRSFPFDIRSISIRLSLSVHIRRGRILSCSLLSVRIRSYPFLIRSYPFPNGYERVFASFEAIKIRSVSVRIRSYIVTNVYEQIPNGLGIR
jgi:hypothetical protein